MKFKVNDRVYISSPPLRDFIPDALAHNMLYHSGTVRKILHAGNWENEDTFQEPDGTTGYLVVLDESLSEFSCSNEFYITAPYLDLIPTIRLEQIW